MRMLVLVGVLVVSGCGRGGGSSVETGNPVSPASQPTVAPVAQPVTSAPVDVAPARPVVPDLGGQAVGAPVVVGKPPATPPSTKPRIEPSTPAELYAQCESRLEQPEAAGECKADSDCVNAGCSSEICTTKVAAADLMTTCEMLPCFEVVDTCGCVEGQCRWSLVDVMPAPRRIDLPQ